jgi:hypothetical protein
VKFTPSTDTLNTHTILVEGGSPDTALGCALVLSRDAGFTTWNIMKDDGAGAYTTILSGVDLTPNPGDTIEIDLSYNPRTDKITFTVNGTVYGTETPHAPNGLQVYKQRVIVIDQTPGSAQYLESWCIRGTPLEFSPYDTNFGSVQGRLSPSGWTPTGGQYAFVLGSDVAGRYGDFFNGDSISISQVTTLTNGDLVSLKLRFRTPIPNKPNFSWRFSILTTTGGVTKTMVQRDLVDGTTREQVSMGFAWTYPTSSDVLVTFKLSFIGSGGEPFYDVELPGVYLDDAAVVASGTRYVLQDLDPEVDEEGVYSEALIGLTLVDTTGVSTPDLTATLVTVEGATAYQNGSFYAPFDGPGSKVTTPYLGASRITLDYTGTWPHLTTRKVNVTSRTADLAATLDEDYDFTSADIVGPHLDSVEAQTYRIMRLFFTDDSALVMSSSTGSNDALNPANYTLAATTVPAFVPGVSSVVRVDDYTVDLYLDDEITAGASYVLTVENVEDEFGNVVS